MLKENKSKKRLNEISKLRRFNNVQLAKLYRKLSMNDEPRKSININHNSSLKNK